MNGPYGEQTHNPGIMSNNAPTYLTRQYHKKPWRNTSSSTNFIWHDSFNFF
ncbi:hypothetical protein Nmel_008447 [Mimus melanotis]